jgi:hypothetical protein
MLPVDGSPRHALGRAVRATGLRAPMKGLRTCGEWPGACGFACGPPVAVPRAGLPPPMAASKLSAMGPRLQPGAPGRLPTAPRSAPRPRPQPGSHIGGRAPARVTPVLVAQRMALHLRPRSHAGVPDDMRVRRQVAEAQWSRARRTRKRHVAAVDEPASRPELRTTHQQASRSTQQSTCGPSPARVSRMLTRVPSRAAPPCRVFNNAACYRQTAPR